MSIKILPPQLANQIAAGEVVERPSSVVKELVENALDAGAQKIEIDIERGGHKKITIKDDGKGISKDQLALALSRHATSKISDIEDLEAIVSLGFRGEALASISSVSRLTITSKPPFQDKAWSAIAEGLDMAVDVKPAAHPNGTSVEVLDLFFNTPARRKFLRAEKTEFSHIETLIKRIAMSRPDITFILKHNAKTVKRYRSQSYIDDRIERQSGRIAEVVNRQFIEETSVRTIQYDNVEIAVWARSPDTCRSVNPAQYAFVNGRMMRDKLIQHAIRQAYADTLHPEQQPEYALFIDLPATDVDVNVHPAKHEVRFHHARLLHDLIVSSIQECIEDFMKPQPLITDDHVSNSGTEPLESSPQPAVQETTIPSPLLIAESEATMHVAAPNKPTVQPEWVVSSQYTDHQHAVEATQIERASLSVHDKPVIEQRFSGLTSNTASNNKVQPDLIQKELTELKIEETLSVSPSKSITSQSSSSQLGCIVLAFDESSAFFKYQDQVWLCSLQKLLSTTNVNAQEQPQSTLTLDNKDLSATPLLVPVRIRLNKDEINTVDVIQPVLSECGFVTKRHNDFVIIKQVPSFIRAKNNARYLPQLFEYIFQNEKLTQTQLMAFLLGPEQNVVDLEKIEQELRILLQGKDNIARLKTVATPLSGQALLSLLNV